MTKTPLFGLIKIDFLTEDEFIKRIVIWSDKRYKKSIFYTNVHGVNCANIDKEYLNAVNSADLVYSDGWGTALAVRMTENSKAERVNAADLMDNIFAKLRKTFL